MNLCSVHFVNHCPLCLKLAPPAPLVPDTPISEAAAIIAGQTKLVPIPAPESITTSTTTESSVTFLTSAPEPKITDEHANRVLDLSQAYALACEEVHRLTDQVTLLTAQTKQAEAELDGAAEKQRKAKSSLFQLVKPQEKSTS